MYDQAIGLAATGSDARNGSRTASKALHFCVSLLGLAAFLALLFQRFVR
jgi:hypothetical protein